MTVWDYIIVGAGSAGCALTYQLARRTSRDSILVLEAGSSDRSLFVRFPAGQIRAIANHDWGYRSEPDPTRNGACESWSRGRILGGSSSINGTMYVRGAAADFTRWSALFCGNSARWSADELLAIFRELEASDRTDALRGRIGRLHVRTVRRPHTTTQAFIEAACACGHPFNDDYNGATQEGVAYAQLSQRAGLRCSAADAFLKPLAGNQRVKLLLKALVQKIEFVGQRATAVSFLHNGRRRREAAQRIVLCAGAINSPKLLMLSGIGEPDELSSHGITPVLRSPGVGWNLKEHPLLKLTYRTNVPTYNLTRGLPQKLEAVFEFIRHREGPIANLFESTAFLRSSPTEPRPDIQLHFLPAGYLTTAAGAFELAPYPSATVLLNKSYPRSCGRVRLRSSDPSEPPLIECRLLEKPEDVETMIRGVSLVRTIVQTQPLAGLVAEEIAPGPQLQDRAALQDYVRNHTGIAFHPLGTCRMGLDDSAVVGPDLRVRGSDNLWIADASVMPDSISGNTNAACMMIGAKLGKEL
jgi:choline dehydrogenase